MSQPVGAIVKQGQIVENVQAISRVTICGRQKPPSFSCGFEFTKEIAFQISAARLCPQFAIRLITGELYDLAWIRREHLVFLRTVLQVKNQWI